MKELSLNVLDIVENSTKAKASLVEISITENNSELKIEITDDGIGMTREILDSVTNPFCTTRKTRRVGLGIPLFKLAAEQTGGEFKIISKHIDEYPNAHGTVVSAAFSKEHIDFTPLGDIISTIVTLIQGHPTVDFLFTHTTNDKSVRLDTRELREVLGDVPLDSFEILIWIRDYLTEQYN